MAGHVGNSGGLEKTPAQTERLRFWRCSDVPDEALIRELIHEPYRRILTKNMTRIRSKKVEICFSNDWVGPGLLKLIAMTQRKAYYSQLHDLQRKVVHEPVYSEMAEWRGAVDAVELDLDQAYLNSGIHLNVFPQTFGMDLSEISKPARLKCMGCLGTRKFIEDYNEHHEMIWESPELIARTRPSWEAIVAETDLIMQLGMKEAGDDFLYYWTDAIFVRPKAHETVAKILKSQNYHLKERRLFIKRQGPSIITSDGRPFPATFREAK